MDSRALEELSPRTESGSASEPDFVRDLLRGPHAACPGQRPPDATVLTISDAALALICRRLPGWVVSHQGEASEPDGNWTCSLRETGMRDDDDLFGTGRGRTPALAPRSALLLTLARRAPRSAA